ncbi:pyrroloquinoline quinone precursor peptide PqqA [Streptomyces sp. PKU-EA00015]|nr:pyrroloquinoline quinone precursor peptide PqqA [Streptomyces sp. PKU-EA00015]NWF29884.1 pyrroloquinoline quinone precursor peptide PqqA [Streptomyces sp. PKU-EA00015]
MNEAEALTEQAEETAVETTDDSAWETPGHTVVETAREVTGQYSDSV